MIPLARPALGAAEEAAACRVIRSGWLTQGPEVEAFEREFAAAVGATHACAVANCTVALQLALQVAGVGPGDEVVTVSHTYIATANAIRHCGAEPVFVDIDPATGNIDPAQVEAALTPRTAAILCVHQIGVPCDLARLVPLARRRGLPLIEDAACAIGSEILWDGRWERIGRPHGDVACFSLHPRKVLSTGDGGMITTAHPAWDRRYRRLRQHAMDVSDTVRHRASEVVFERYPEVGYNYRLTDLQAAIGREQLKRLPDLVASRRAAADVYARLLPEHAPGLKLPVEPAWARGNWQSYGVMLPAGVDQRAVMQAALDAGVSTRRGVMCCHREPAYAGQPLRHPLPHSEAAQDRGLLLPMYADITPAEQQQVAEVLGAALAAVGVAPLAA